MPKHIHLPEGLPIQFADLTEIAEGFFGQGERDGLSFICGLDSAAAQTVDDRDWAADMFQEAFWCPIEIRLMLGTVPYALHPRER